jgi:hypothetical protein
MAKHLGGFDCDLCVVNYARKETLHQHFHRAHQSKLNPEKDYGHLTKAERDSLIQQAKEKKTKGTVTPIDPVPLPPVSTSGKNLTGDQIMLKCMEVSAIDSPSTRDLLTFLDTSDSTATSSQAARVAPSASGGDRVSPIDMNTGKDNIVPNGEVTDVNKLINYAFNIPIQIHDLDINNVHEDNMKSPIEPMDQTVSGTNEFDETAQEVEIIIVPEVNDSIQMPENTDNMEQSPVAEGSKSDQMAEDPYDKYSVVTMDTVDQIVERIRQRNVRLYLHMLAKFHHMSVMAENLDIQGDLDTDEIFKEILSHP